MAVKRKTKGNKRPFEVSGRNIVAPKGISEWCKIVEPDYMFDDQGEYSVSVIVDPEDPVVIKYIETLEALRDEAEVQVRENLGSEVDDMEIEDVVSEELDKDYNPTGMLKLKFKLPKVDTREEGKDFINVIDEYKKPIAQEDLPLVGNGSIVRCRRFTYPYFVAGSTKVVKGKKVVTPPRLGVAGLWNMMQLIKLEEYSEGSGGTSGFDDESESEEDGFENETGGEEQEEQTPVKKTRAKKVKKEEEDGDY